MISDYLIAKIGLPGGFSGYVGEFLTQFYFLSLAGPLIITLLLIGIQMVSRKIFSKTNLNSTFSPFSFIPSLLAAILLCDEFYPLSAIIGFLAALLAGWLYMTINEKKWRFIAGILLIPLTYWLAGGSFLMLLAIMVIYELFVVRKSEKVTQVSDIQKNAINLRLNWWHISVFVIISVSIPLIVRSAIILQPLNLTYLSEFYYDLRTILPPGILVLFAIPPALMIVLLFLPRNEKKYHAAIYFQIAALISSGYLGVRLCANFDAEEIYTYDYFARNGRWKDVISYAGKKPPRNDLSLSMLNLSLGKTGKMGYNMFRYEQNGDEGLFLPAAQDHIASLLRSEIFFHLGLINASQESAFESMETTPNLKKSVRSIKRLAETNLLNGHCEVAGKYIKLLKNTIFYKKWALEAEKYLYNEELISENAIWAEQKKLMLTKDSFFKAQNIESIIKMLYLSLDENPRNRIAFEYLMAHYLINKDLIGISNCIPTMDKIKYSEIPLNYQEAFLFITELTPEDERPDIQNKVSEYTKQQMKGYIYSYAANKDPREYLKKKFQGTYWYYFDFKNIKISD